MTAAIQTLSQSALAERAAPSGATRVAAATEPTQYLTFLLEKEMFALGILAIREIIEYHELTLVPMMPAWIRGVINLRGAVVPVIDLAARFNRVPQGVTKRTCIVIAEVQNETDRQVVGVVVDAVSQVLAISDADIEPPPPFGARIRADFIEGLAKVEGKFVIVLNVNHVLSIDELSTLGAEEQAGEEDEERGGASEDARPSQAS
jgi:purine-binding chemotaxis protein CheW